MSATRHQRDIVYREKGRKGDGGVFYLRADVQ
jgi:hypothetical protein